MHETSLVKSLLDRVDEQVQATPLAIVREIGVELGPLSGVEPLLIQSAFEQLVATRNYTDAKLVIQEVPLEALCQDCRATIQVNRFVFQCSECGSARLQVTRGDAFRLLSITIEEPEEVESHEH